MGEAVQNLLRHMPEASGFDLPYSEIRDMQIAALNERLQERVDKIKIVALRAKDSGVTEITKLEDVVPLLLPSARNSRNCGSPSVVRKVIRRN